MATVVDVLIIRDPERFSDERVPDLIVETRNAIRVYFADKKRQKLKDGDIFITMPENLTNDATMPSVSIIVEPVNFELTPEELKKMSGDIRTAIKAQKSLQPEKINSR
jgi:hypothetical protein